MDLLPRTIAAQVHGRYLLRVPSAPGPWPALFSFHGYGEDAETNMAALHRIPHVDGWLLVAVQALHPFYTKSQRIVANWMTSQDRERAITDNIAYVRSVVDAVGREYPITELIVFAGFSQGAAMAYRAAAHVPSGGLIALAGDLPPDVDPPQRLPHVLVCRGLTDDWYTEEKMAKDVGRLGHLAASVETRVLTGGHEWTDAFAETAGEYLVRLATAPRHDPSSRRQQR